MYSPALEMSEWEHLLTRRSGHASNPHLHSSVGPVARTLDWSQESFVILSSHGIEKNVQGVEEFHYAVLNQTSTSSTTMASFMAPNPPLNVDMKPIQCVLSSGHMVMNSA